MADKRDPERVKIFRIEKADPNLTEEQRKKRRRAIIKARTRAQARNVPKKKTPKPQENEALKRLERADFQTPGISKFELEFLKRKMKEKEEEEEN